MPVTVFLLSLLVFSTSLHAQQGVYVPVVLTPKQFQLQGNVDSVYSITYGIQLNNRTMPDSTVFVDTVLSKSKETKLVFDSMGRLVNRQVDSFDMGGKMVRKNEERYYFGGERLMAMASFEDGKLKDSISLSYNRKGYIDEQARYDKRHRIQGFVQYFYRNDKVFNIKQRDADRRQKRFIRMEYNYSGRITERQEMDENMRVAVTVEYSYDTLDDGSIQVNEFNYDGERNLTGMDGHIINKQGQLAELSEIDADKRMKRQSTYTYNDRGIIASERTFTTIKEGYTFTYGYDEQGNWKTRHRFSEGLPTAKTHRVISYSTGILLSPQPCSGRR